MKNTLLAVAALAASVSASAETIILKSPDGRNEISLATEPALTVSVARDGKPVLGPAPISMTFDGKGVIGGAGAYPWNMTSKLHDNIWLRPSSVALEGLGKSGSHVKENSRSSV